MGASIALGLFKQNLLSVIIPTRDHLSLLQACLESISAVPAGVDLELIVVDNGSVGIHFGLLGTV